MHAAAAVERLGTLQYFPSKNDDIARDEVAALLLRMVPDEDALNELIVRMVDVGTWYGTGEMRGVLCTFTDPMDGVKGRCIKTPGYTAEALEALHVQRQFSDQKQIAAATSEPPLTEEERQFIEEMNAKILRNKAKRMVGRPTQADYDYSRKLLGDR